MRKFKKRRREVRREEIFQAAWEELVRRYGPSVRGHVRWSLQRRGLPPEPEEVDDGMQEVYCRLILGGTFLLGQLRRWSEAQVISYLARVAERVVVDGMRSQAAIKRGGGFRTGFASRLADVADPRGTPEDLALLADWRRLLFERCRALAGAAASPRERERRLRILWRMFIEGWSSREIACAEAGLARSSVEGLVYRARRRLIQDLRVSSWRSPFRAL